MASREASGYEGEASPAGTYGNCAGQQKQGNGAQTGFATGATRSTDAGKVDFEGHINPEVLAIFGDYMNRHRVQRDGRVRASDNWQQGIPVYRYMKSLVRHTFELWRMWRGSPVRNIDNEQLFTFRDVLCAIMFNTMGLIYEMDRAKQDGWLDRQYVTPELRRQLESVDEPKAQEMRVPTEKEMRDAQYDARIQRAASGGVAGYTYGEKG